MSSRSVIGRGLLIGLPPKVRDRLPKPYQPPSTGNWGNVGLAKSGSTMSKHSGGAQSCRICRSQSPSLVI
ncbi:hypothetical protein [Coleofasciculus chthonoplastes]|uniref:hypothetical protein n=1 Tax=Coleofasciculus TaxID=669368 RepID=UPI0032F839F1